MRSSEQAEVQVPFLFSRVVQSELYLQVLAIWTPSTIQYATVIDPYFDHFVRGPCSHEQSDGHHAAHNDDYRDGNPLATPDVQPQDEHSLLPDDRHERRHRC